MIGLRNLSSGAAGSLISLALTLDASAQGVWSQLENMGKEKPHASQPTIPGKTWKELCDDAETDPLAPKCRGYYLSNKYSVHWRGEDTRSSHGVLIEVLVRGGDAVVCYNASYDLDETSPCTTLRRVN